MKDDELTELEPLDPDELPELPELQDLPELAELPELPEVEELKPLEEIPELPDDAAAAKSAPAAAPKAVPKPEPKSEPKSEPKAAPRPAPEVQQPAPSPAPAKEAAAELPAAAAKPEPKPVPRPAPRVEQPVLAKEASAPPPATAAAKPEPETKEATLEEVPAPAAKDAAPAPAEVAPGEKPPLRVLDKAPFHLRKAALIVCAGSLLPWMAHGGGLLTSVGAKVLVLAGVWLWLQQINHNWGPKLGGFLGKLGELELRKSKQADPKKPRRARPGAEQRPAVLTHPFPTGLHSLSLLVMIAGTLVLPALELSGGPMGKAVAELGMLAWAGYTWVHIHSYERWGAFNPIFPLMFLAMLLCGLLQLVVGFGMEQGGPIKLAAIAGGGVVAFGGGLAAYTIVEALMQAKKEGDAKKTAALEARRAGRKKS